MACFKRGESISKSIFSSCFSFVSGLISFLRRALGLTAYGSSGNSVFRLVLGLLLPGMVVTILF